MLLVNRERLLPSLFDRCRLLFTSICCISVLSDEAKTLSRMVDVSPKRAGSLLNCAERLSVLFLVSLYCKYDQEKRKNGFFSWNSLVTLTLTLRLRVLFIWRLKVEGASVWNCSALVCVSLVVRCHPMAAFAFSCQRLSRSSISRSAPAVRCSRNPSGALLGDHSPSPPGRRLSLTLLVRP